MTGTVLALAGGVGGAKLALGLSKALPPDNLTIVVNTGDDTIFHGLHISPDLDTVMYALAGLTNTETGWGIAGDTFNTLGQLERFGSPVWFNLGDKDLATHIRRTELLGNGSTLSEATRFLCASLDIGGHIVPMTDDPVHTMVETSEGVLPFQTYFVREQCRPVTLSIRYDGVEDARPSPGFLESLETASHLIICPSNPFLSVDPILALPGVRQRLDRFAGRRLAVSPIVGGEAVRGPAGKLMRELGHDVSCVGVARYYQDLCDIFIIDEMDEGRAGDMEALGMKVHAAPTIMNNDEDKERLARLACRLLGVPPAI